MKKAISLIWYIICTLISGAGAVYFYFGAQMAEDWAAVGAALLCAISIAVVIPSIIALLCKIIHIRTDWKFFGFICILIDFIASLMLDSVIWEDIISGNFGVSTLVIIVPGIIVLISLIANIASLRD